MEDPVAVITGANSGIGLMVAKRLLSEVSSPSKPVRLCLACRSIEKAKATRKELLRAHPFAHIDVLEVDTSIPESAKNAAQELMKRYNNIAWLFLNAGIMPVKGYNMKSLCNLNKDFWAKLFSTGEGLLLHHDWTIADTNLQAVFATNVLGHYIMVRELEEYLKRQTNPCHIIWTSSNTARTARLDISDIQNKKCDGPYPHSKRLMDLISLSINKRLNKYGVYSDTVCPGMVVSQMTAAIMPLFMWYLILPIILIIRLFITHFITFKAENGSESLIWLAKNDPALIDHSLKYFSRTPPCGATYIHKEKIPFTESLLINIREEMETIADSVLLPDNE